MARRKVKLSNDVAAAVPLSSMIDIVFLLLIYFIFTQKPVVEDVYLQLDLPSPTPPTSSNETPPPILRIDVMKLPENLDNDDWIYKELKKAKTQAEVKAILAKERVHYHVNTSGDASGTPMSVQALHKYLKQIADTAPETTIVINCGPNAKHKKLVRLLDMCDELGLTHLNLLNDATVQFVPDPPEKRN